MAGLGEHVDDIASSLRACMAYIKPSRTVTIGASMGGYAALMFAKLIGVDRALAFAPLSTLDPTVAAQAQEWRWLDVMQGLQSAPPCSAAVDLPPLLSQPGHHPEMHVLYGPAGGTEANPNLDPWHAARLADLPNMHIHALGDADHAVAYYLKKLGLLEALLTDLITRPVSLPPSPNLAPLDTPTQWALEDGWLSEATLPRHVQRVTLWLRAWVAGSHQLGMPLDAMLARLTADGWTPEVALRAMSTTLQWCGPNARAVHALPVAGQHV